MRLATLASIGLIAASTAALAQVTGAPTEEKVPQAGNAVGNDVAAPDGDATQANTAAPDAAAAGNTLSPPANDMAPATPGPDQKAPRRRR